MLTDDDITLYTTGGLRVARFLLRGVFVPSTVGACLADLQPVSKAAHRIFNIQTREMPCSNLRHSKAFISCPVWIRTITK